MPDPLRAPRARSWALTSSLLLWCSSCLLFEDVLPPGAIPPAPNNASNNRPQPLTCQSAPCDEVGAWRCQGTSRQQCALTPECTLWTERERCQRRELTLTRAIPNAAEHSTPSVLTASGRVLGRGDELITLSPQGGVSRKRLGGSPLTALAPSTQGFVALRADHSVLLLDEQLGVLDTQPAPPGATTSALAWPRPGQPVSFWSQGARVHARGVDLEWERTLEATRPVRAMAEGLEGAQLVLYVVTPNEILKLNAQTGQTLTSAPLVALSIVAENGGLWAISQRALHRFEGADFSQPAQTFEDVMCGTGVSLSAAQGALWMTDLAGCLSRFDLRTRQLSPSTLDLNNRVGGPAMTNLRPMAPAFARGVGYAVARTTEIVAFDPQTMQELKRQVSLAQEPLTPLEVIEDDQLLASGKAQGVLLAPLCPCEP